VNHMCRRPAGADVPRRASGEFHGDRWAHRGENLGAAAHDWISMSGPEGDSGRGGSGALPFADLGWRVPRPNRQYGMVARWQLALVAASHAMRARGLVAVTAKSKTYALRMSGVRVSVAPEVVLIHVGTEKLVGAVNFQCSTTAALSAAGLQYVATLVHRALEQSGAAPF
jgi:hypothetical protein